MTIGGRAAGAVDAVDAALRFRPKGEPDEGANPDIVWGSTAAAGVSAPTADGARIRVKLAGAGNPPARVVRPTLRVFPDAFPATDVVGQSTPGGFRLITVSHSAEAPSEFRFPVVLPPALSLALSGAGGFDILRPGGAAVGRFWAAWGRDAGGRPVRVTYALSGTDLIMTVDLAEASFPVVADPLYTAPTG
ncbi:MAG: hypothetical protein GEV11_04590 [Streptosporangiales bacterium]|nr:hypothetical protein [Streptosporangiales bacterium]